MFHLTPSTIARYFFQDCERFLRYRAAPARERAATGIPERDFDHSPLMQAVLASGHVWERTVVEKILKGKVAVAAGAQPLHERRFNEAQTIDRLRREPAGRFIYQPTLNPPP